MGDWWADSVISVSADFGGWLVGDSVWGFFEGLAGEHRLDRALASNWLSESVLPVGGAPTSSFFSLSKCL